MPKDLKLSDKALYISFLAGALFYVAYYFKFPNSYSLLLSFIFLTLLIKNFKKIEGLKIIIYSLVISLITLAPSINIASSLARGISLFSLNAFILLLMIFGLKYMKKWAMVFSIIMLSLSWISVIIGIAAYDANYFGWTLQNVILNLKTFAAASLSLVSIAFLVRFRKSFSSRK